MGASTALSHTYVLGEQGLKTCVLVEQELKTCKQMHRSLGFDGSIDSLVPIESVFYWSTPQEFMRSVTLDVLTVIAHMLFDPFMLRRWLFYP
jgi:hypothetical protein